MKLSNYAAVIAALLSVSISGYSQESGKVFVSVQMIGGVSVPDISVSVNGAAWYPKLKAGQKTSGGKMDILSWDVVITDPVSTQSIAGKQNLSPSKSYSIALIGDFKMIPKDPKDSKSKLESRGRVLFLENNFAANDRDYRLRIVNGLADDSIEVSLKGGQTLQILPMQSASKSSLPRSFEAEAKVGDQVISLPFLYLPPTRGVTLIFYKNNDQIKYVASSDVILNESGEVPAAGQEEVRKIIESQH